VGYTEVLRTARLVFDTYYDLAMHVLIVVALIFLVLTYLGNTALSFVEQRVSIPGLQMPGARTTRRRGRRQHKVGQAPR
jgi:ABC-type arginine transport system permease subunit